MVSIALAIISVLAVAQGSAAYHPGPARTAPLIKPVPAPLRIQVLDYVRCEFGTGIGMELEPRELHQARQQVLDARLSMWVRVVTRRSPSKFGICAIAVGRRIFNREKLDMTRGRYIRISALNVAMHKPHSPQRYVELLKDARRLNVLIKLGALHGAMLGSVDEADNYKEGGILTGEIFRFVQLDASQPWFNAQTSEAASEDDMGGVSIPPHLLPHLQRINFVFLPDTHELWFISQDRQDRIGAEAATMFFQRLFDLVYQNGKCTQVEVTALPDIDTLDRMLSLHVLQRMTIDLKRPNADDGHGEEERWLKRLEDQGIRRQEMSLVASAGESIKPDEETKALARVAARNGSVSVVGKDADGLRYEESTVAKPLVLLRHVKSAIETSLDVLKRTALQK